eukprot:CAMPEP_0204501068 /NCGR_PEP_ID=MMETSP0471-20130131/98489_1 /ASSEMBLY_ACC=CAM_ASM_000602 /TAXON_ID=2969 /ORGANISM="Oxyrrhis marina" /LENGTH=44 /DNA_ID= /DNA_START= /DNA_END= /DNA_ORIENTATION=
MTSDAASRDLVAPATPRRCCPCVRSCLASAARSDSKDDAAVATS